MIIATSLVCLALTIHQESRGESLKGQIAVASVVMNRVELNNTAPCEEITKPYQFPWAKGKIRRIHNDYHIHEKALPHGKSWDSAVTLATAILDGTQKIIPRIRSFHNVFEHPKWLLHREFILGHHIFYS